MIYQNNIPFIRQWIDRTPHIVHGSFTSDYQYVVLSIKDRILNKYYTLILDTASILGYIYNQNYHESLKHLDPVDTQLLVHGSYE